MPNKQDHGTPFMQTATNATSAVATQTGVPLQTIYVTDVSGSSDLTTATLLVKDGATTIFQTQVGASAYEHGFITPLKLSVGGTLTVTVSGTALCNANVSGYIINNS